MSMVLQSKVNGDFKPHPEGIHPAVCVDVIDLGLTEVEFQGQRKMVNKLRLVFESEQKLDDGRNCTISKNFTASLHPKAKLAEFLGKWRGRPVVPGETIDLAKLIGACCTIVVSHQQNQQGQTYAAIDAISKPTKRLAASGHYDPTATRQRIEEWKARQQGAGSMEQGANRQALGGVESRGTRVERPAQQQPAMQGTPKSGAAPAAQQGQPPFSGGRTPAPAPADEAQGQNPRQAPADYDEEVGF